MPDAPQWPAPHCRWSSGPRHKDRSRSAASVIFSMSSTGPKTGSCPIARSAAAVRSASGRGRVSSSRSQATVKKSGPPRAFNSLPGIRAQPIGIGDRALSRASRTPRCHRGAGSCRESAAHRRRWSQARRSACGMNRRALQEMRVRCRARFWCRDRRSAPASRAYACRSTRASMPIAPCPIAGGNASSGRMAVATSSRPSRLRPASASKVASTSPASSLRNRDCTLPRNTSTRRSGRIRFTSA